MDGKDDKNKNGDNNYDQMKLGRRNKETKEDNDMLFYIIITITQVWSSHQTSDASSPSLTAQLSLTCWCRRVTLFPPPGTPRAASQTLAALINTNRFSTDEAKYDKFLLFFIVVTLIHFGANIHYLS